MGIGRDRDDPVGDMRQQKRGEGEVPEMVRADLPFESVGCSRFRDQHDPGVIDEDVQVAGPSRGKGANGREIFKVKRPHLRVADDRRSDSLTFDLVPDGEDDPCSRAGQRASRSRTDSARGARHHDDPAGQVRDVCGGPVAVRVRHRPPPLHTPDSRSGTRRRPARRRRIIQTRTMYADCVRRTIECTMYAVKPLRFRGMKTRGVQWPYGSSHPSRAGSP